MQISNSLMAVHCQLFLYYLLQLHCHNVTNLHSADLGIKDFLNSVNDWPNIETN